MHVFHAFHGVKKVFPPSEISPKEQINVGFPEAWRSSTAQRCADDFSSGANKTDPGAGKTLSSRVRASFQQAKLCVTDPAISLFGENRPGVNPSANKRRDVPFFCLPNLLGTPGPRCFPGRRTRERIPRSSWPGISLVPTTTAIGKVKYGEYSVNLLEQVRCGKASGRAICWTEICGRNLNELFNPLVGSVEVDFCEVHARHLY